MTASTPRPYPVTSIMSVQKGRGFFPRSRTKLPRKLAPLIMIYHPIFTLLDLASTKAAPRGSDIAKPCGERGITVRIVAIIDRIKHVRKLEVSGEPFRKGLWKH